MSSPKNTHTPRFDPSSYEAEIRTQWENEGIYKTTEHPQSDKKKYILVMFPYPSGDGLHIGHARIYTGSDVLARYYRMKGYSVLFPMGWDAFGLPAENAAIKKKTNPKKLVPGNIENFRKQFKRLGMSFDWEKELATSDPDYYAITQKLFITFFKHGLLYKKDTPVYYCPFCKTGLAQEEVLGDGTHERCGNPVEKRNLPQWIFRITKYADSLLEGLDDLDWPKGVIEMQKNWIGRKEGLNIRYDIEGYDESVTCFTTRPDTNFGATFIVLAPEHDLVSKIIEGVFDIDEAQEKAVIEYVEKALRKTERERLADAKQKTGVFTGLYGVNQLNGEKLPIWISDFVLDSVGTGAVVGVPGHDVRDFEFAQAMGLPVKRVIEGPDKDTSEIVKVDQVQENEGLVINSGFLNGLEPQEASEKVAQYLEEKGYAERQTNYHLRDWVFSRQRYWGEPIPMVYCQACAEKGISYWNSALAQNDDIRLNKGPENNDFKTIISEIEDSMHGWFPLSEDNLPLTLPDIESYEPTETGESPLSKVDDWVRTECPACGGPARRETDTMPNWAGSSWYFLAFSFAEKIRSGHHSLDSESINEWLPVDWYLGGAEHAVLHLLYARFWIHILNDLGSVEIREPFVTLRNVGMVLAEGGVKMSKSKGNVINPDDVVNEYGTDALRVYEMFMAPFGQEIVWTSQALQGAYRFLRRIWQIYQQPARIAKESQEQEEELVAELQRAIHKIDKDIPDVKFNTPLSTLMELLNIWEREGVGLSKDNAGAFLKLLAPFAPHISDYLWREKLGGRESIHNEMWPEANAELAKETIVPMAVQVNGKVRDVLDMPIDISKAEAGKRALSSEKIKKWIGDNAYNVVFVPGRIINFVIRE